MPNRTTMRTVHYNGADIHYRLERKKVKNINLRIRIDGSVGVSAPYYVSAERIDGFVLSKGGYILNAVNKFAQMQAEARPAKYETGERIRLLGRDITLEVLPGQKDGVTLDGEKLCLTVKDMGDTAKKQRLVKRFLDEQCKAVFSDMVKKVHPAFAKYGIAMPVLKIREMKSRWGSCLVHKGTITLNRRLIEKPISCIEYVTVHEFCHFIHPDHSKAFYALLEEHMPNWKEQKELLNK